MIARFLLCVFLTHYGTLLVSAQWAGATIDTLTHDAFRDEIDKQSLAIDDAGTLRAVWKKANPGGGWRLFSSKRAASGSWTSPQEIADSTLLIFGYALTVDPQSGKGYVAYERESAVPSEILLAEDSAGTWIHTRITENTTEDLSPSIAVDGSGSLHLVWIGQDSLSNWKIMYATNRSSVWVAQLLAGSDLGSFGSGASPFIAVTSAGIAHLFYRGGDFSTYHIHHAWNQNPGGTTWNYEIITTENANDFSACAMITPDTTIHLLASGNDGFGFPPRAFYMKKPAGGNWTTPQRANPSASGWGGSLFVDRFGDAHITWNEASGNIYTGNLYYASNRTGAWTNSPILADGKTYSGVLVLDRVGRGHALAFNGETAAAQEIFAVHSPGILTTIQPSPLPAATEFRLFQNSPNPFNSRTIIRFEIGSPASVTFAIYNVLGQEVARPVSGHTFSGVYTVDFDATHLPTGVYLYQLKAGTVSSSKKMLYVK